MRTSLIDTKAAEANRKRIMRLRAEENGGTRFKGGQTLALGARGGVHKPKERQG